MVGGACGSLICAMRIRSGVWRRSVARSCSTGICRTRGRCLGASSRGACRRARSERRLLPEPMEIPRSAPTPRRPGAPSANRQMLEFNFEVTMLAYIYVVFAVVLRFLPPLGDVPCHFTPVCASLLYFGARRPVRQVWAPFLLLALGDLALNRFVYHIPFGGDQFVVWAWYVAALGLGWLLRNRMSVARL